jgi:hypothetical protein
MTINPEFVRRAAAVEAELRRDPFLVLVWGPGLADQSAPALKRRLVRQELESAVGKENVWFSEDPELQDMTAESGQFGAEYVQARAADAVVIIAESHGSLVESAMFQHEIAGKAVVFVQRRPGGPFAKEAYALLRVEEIDPEEWQRCDRVRHLAKRFVRTLLVQKRRSRVIRFPWE